MGLVAKLTFSSTVALMLSLCASAIHVAEADTDGPPVRGDAMVIVEAGAGVAARVDVAGGVADSADTDRPFCRAR